MVYVFRLKNRYCMPPISLLIPTRLASFSTQWVPWYMGYSSAYAEEKSHDREWAEKPDRQEAGKQ